MMKPHRRGSAIGRLGGEGRDGRQGVGRDGGGGAGSTDGGHRAGTRHSGGGRDGLVRACIDDDYDARDEDGR